MTGSQASTGGSSCGNNNNYSPWGSNVNGYQENIYNNPMPYPPPHQQPHRFAPQSHQSAALVGGMPPNVLAGSNCCGPASVSGGVPHQYRNFTNEFQPKRCAPQHQQQQRQCGSCDALTSPQTPLLPNPEWYPTHNSHPNGIYACNSDCSDHSLKSHLHGHRTTTAGGVNGGPPSGGRGKRHHHNHTHNGKGSGNSGGHQHGFGPSHSSSELKSCCNGGGVDQVMQQPHGQQRHLQASENMDGGCDISCLNGNNSSSSSSNNNCSSNNSSINMKSARLNRSASSGCGNGSEDCNEDDSQLQQLVKQSSLSSASAAGGAAKHSAHNNHHHNHAPTKPNSQNGMYNHYEECGGDGAAGMDCCSMSRDATEEDDCEEEGDVGNNGGCCEDDTCCSCSESSCLYAEAVEPVHQAQIIRVGHN